MPVFRSILLVAAFVAFASISAAHAASAQALELLERATAVLLDLDLIDAEDFGLDDARNPYGLVGAKVEYDADVTASLKTAADDLASAVRLDPELKEAYYRLGVAASALGDIDVATPAFTRTMELEPERTAVYFHMAELYWQNERFDDALKLADDFLSRFPDERLDALLIKGATYFKKGAFDDAAAKALEILALDPENMDGLLLLGASRYAGGKTVKAEEAFAAARRLDPETARHIMDIKWGIDRKAY